MIVMGGRIVNQAANMMCQLRQLWWRNVLMNKYDVATVGEGYVYIFFCNAYTLQKKKFKDIKVLGPTGNRTPSSGIKNQCVAITP